MSRKLVFTTRYSLGDQQVSLSVRLANVLMNGGFLSYSDDTIDEHKLRKALTDKSFHRSHNVGAKTVLEALKLLGIVPPKRERCPTCGALRTVA